MHAVLALAPFVLATTSLAMPAARQVAPGPCANFGSAGFDNAKNFTLAAVNTTLPNANTTGAPLVLGTAGAIDGAELDFLSTWASYHFNKWPGLSLSLVDGGLIGNVPDVNGPVAVSGGATNNSAITFLSTSLNPSSPQKVYCGVASTDPAGHSSGFPLLALNGQTDLFSICKTGTSATSQDSVFYNMTANGGASCYTVTLQLIGLK